MMFWGIRLNNRLWLFGLVALVGLLGVIYLLLSHGAKSPITQDLLGRQAVIARADAGNIESFFQALGNSIALRAQLSSMEHLGSATANDLDAFVNQWRYSGLVSGIALTDSRGVVILNSNVEGIQNVGESLADRDYFVWAKNQNKEGEYFVGAPVVSRLGASKGQVIVTIASPVYAKDVFWGVIVAAVKLQPLAQRNLELIKVSDYTNMYLVDQHGELLYSSPGSQMLSEDLKELLSATEQGQLQKGERLIAYTPVELGNQSWRLIISSRFQDISTYSIPFYIRQAAVLLSVSLTTLALGVYVSRQSQNKL